MRDPYLVLGVKRTASTDEIKVAWRRLAKTLHPDRNQNDAQANARFAEAGAAYQLLKDPERRKRYDAEKRSDAPSGRAGEGTPEKDGHEEAYVDIAPNDILSSVWRKMSGKRTAQEKKPDKAPDLAVDAEVTIETIMENGKVTVTLPDGRTLRLALPEGVTDGKQVRVSGQGHRIEGMKRGDVIVTFRIAPHPVFRPKGLDLYTSVPVDIENAVLGCETVVDAPDGPVRITVPEWTSSDTVIRVAGRGLPGKDGVRGDLLAEVRIMLWDHPDEKVKDLMRSLREGLFL